MRFIDKMKQRLSDIFSGNFFVFGNSFPDKSLLKVFILIKFYEVFTVLKHQNRDWFLEIFHFPLINSALMLPEPFLISIIYIISIRIEFIFRNFAVFYTEKMV